MRALRALVLLPLLVAASVPAAGQGDAADVADAQARAVVAPVQLLLDHLPAVLDRAMSEAERDGTPDAAHNLSERMQRFLSGFDGAAAWPGESVAARVDATPAYLFADDVVAVAAAIPAEVAAIARADAMCRSWSQNATVAHARQWDGLVNSASGALNGLLAALEDNAASAPAPLDSGGVMGASKRVEAWSARVLPRAEACLVGLFEALGITRDPARLSLRLLPATTWPLGRVQIVGWAPAGATLEAPTLGFEVRMPAGPIRHAFLVPREATIGQHPVVATAAGQVVRLELEVVRAATRLEVRGPAAILTGEMATFHLRLLVPEARLLDAREALSGPDGAVALDGGVATWVSRAPAPGAWSVTFAYDGSPRLEPAQATWVVTVQAPLAPGPAGPEGGGAGGSDGKSAFQPEPPRGPLGRWLPFGPSIPLAAGLLLAIAAAMVVLVAVAQALRRRDAVDPAVGGPLPAAPLAAPAPPRLPGRLVAAFAALVAWLIRLGRARPSWTARDVGQRLAAEGASLGDVVPLFEAARYGRVALPAQRERAGVGWLRGLWARLGGGR